MSAVGFRVVWRSPPRGKRVESERGSGVNPSLRGRGTWQKVGRLRLPGVERAGGITQPTHLCTAPQLWEYRVGVQDCKNEGEESQQGAWQIQVSEEPILPSPHPRRGERPERLPPLPRLPQQDRGWRVASELPVPRLAAEQAADHPRRVNGAADGDR